MKYMPLATQNGHDKQSKKKSKKKKIQRKPFGTTTLAR